jgi:AP endonuclease 1
MPPKRKPKSVQPEDEGESSRTKKKAKVESVEGELAPNGQPTNKVLPANIVFSPRAEGTTRIAAWNICGLAAASKKARTQPVRGFVWMINVC